MAGGGAVLGVWVYGAGLAWLVNWCAGGCVCGAGHAWHGVVGKAVCGVCT